MGELVLDRQPSGLELWPAVLRAGELVHIAFHASRVVGAMSVPEYDVAVLDSRRRRVATLLRGRARPSNGVICVNWDGRDDDGALVRPGAYRLRIEKVGSSFRLERTLIVEPLVSRVRNSSAFGRRCLPPRGVAPPRRITKYDFVVAPCGAGASAPSVRRRTSDSGH